MTYEELMALPFNKQVNETVKLYCSVNHLPLYVNRKPSKDYFRARAYFYGTKNMVPRQYIKNVWKYLSENKKPCNLYKVVEVANRYVSECQSAREREKVKELKSEVIDVSDYLGDFLNGL